MNDFINHSPSNTVLVQRCLNGNAKAWQQLVDRYSRLVHSVPVRHGLTPAEVDDVGQEVFLALAQYLHQVEDPERIPGWLVTTARRLSWRAIQKRKREAPAVEADLSEAFPARVAESSVTTMPSMSELADGWGRQEVLAEGLQRMGERCRNLIAMVFLDQDEPSYDDISEELGMPKGSIGPTRNRCLKQLRSILEGFGVGPDW